MSKPIMKASVRLARQAFLYGNGDGVPVANVERLAEIGDCHVQTIRTHLPKWMAEREEILAGSSESALSLHLSKETLEAHKSDIKFLRDKLDETKKVIDKLPQLIDNLRDWLNNFQEKDYDLALSMFDSYLKASLSRAKQLDLAMRLQKQWSAASGIEQMADINAAGQKALATGRARLQVRSEEGAAGGSAALPEPAARGRFGQLVDTNPAPPVEDDEEGL